MVSAVEEGKEALGGFSGVACDDEEANAYLLVETRPGGFPFVSGVGWGRGEKGVCPGWGAWVRMGIVPGEVRRGEASEGGGDVGILPKGSRVVGGDRAKGVSGGKATNAVGVGAH